MIGWEPSDKSGRPFSSILLALRERGKLRYSGRVGTGFSAARLDELAGLFARHARAVVRVRPKTAATIARRKRRR